MAKLRAANVAGDGGVYRIDYVQWASSTSSTHNLTNEPPPPPKEVWYAVYVEGDQFFCSKDKEACEQVKQGIIYLNRTFRGRRDAVAVGLAREAKATTNAYELAWNCEWSYGQMGWDAQPMTVNALRDNAGERIIYNDKDRKRAYIKAPSALLAIERAKLAMSVKEGIL